MNEFRVAITGVEGKDTNIILFIKSIELLTALIQIMSENYCVYELNISGEFAEDE